MEKKMTKKEMFGRLIDLLQDMDVEDKADLVAGVQNEIDLINRKAEKSKGYTRAKKEDGLRDAVAGCLSADEFRITADIVADLIVDYPDVTAAKVTARLTALSKEELVVKEDVRTEDGRKVKGYKLA